MKIRLSRKTSEPVQKRIWTIGHSTRPLEEFIGMLTYFQIAVLVDIRRYPGSRKYPQFNQDTLQASLRDRGIEYSYLEGLGGRRKVRPDSTNTVWQNPSFQGYADYMETEAFKKAITELEAMALHQPTAYMCSEAVWWRCHRSLVSDFLKVRGWEVMHIMGPQKALEHPYTAPAKIVEGQLSYGEQ